MDGANEIVTTPRPGFSVLDACAIIVGVVVGVGIFRTPSIVAANVPNEAMFSLAWVLGGLISLIGRLMLCGAGDDISRHVGGDHHYLSRGLPDTSPSCFPFSLVVIKAAPFVTIFCFSGTMPCKSCRWADPVRRRSMLLGGLHLPRSLSWE